MTALMILPLLYDMQEKYYADQRKKDKERWDEMIVPITDKERSDYYKRQYDKIGFD